MYTRSDLSTLLEINIHTVDGYLRKKKIFVQIASGPAKYGDDTVKIFKLIRALKQEGNFRRERIFRYFEANREEILKISDEDLGNPEFVKTLNLKIIQAKSKTPRKQKKRERSLGEA